MFYLLVELQATNEIYDPLGRPRIVPSLCLSTNTVDNKEFIPVFLSKRQAYLYMKSNQLGHEFKIVSTEDYDVEFYRNATQASQDNKLWLCMMVIDLAQKGQKLDIMCWQNTVSLYNVFFNEATLRQELSEILGKYYQLFGEDEQLSDDEIIQSSEPILSGLRTPADPQSNFVTTLYRRFKTAVIGSMNQTVDSKEPVQQKTLEERFREAQQSFNVGRGHLFILKKTDTDYHSRKDQKVDKIPLFVNKLDALIYALILKEVTGESYDAVNFTANSSIKNIFKPGYQKGACEFNVVFGFMANHTPFGPKWAKQNKASPVADMMSFLYTLEAIENGFDLEPYFTYTLEPKEREISLIGLVNTNHTPTETLLPTAKRMLADMKINLVQLNENDPAPYHRMVFYSA